MENEVLEIFKLIEKFSEKYGNGYINIDSGAYKNDNGNNLMSYQYVPEDTVNSFERVFYYDENGITKA